MIMKFELGQTFEYQDAPVTELIGYQNGSFWLTTKDSYDNVIHYAVDNSGTTIRTFSTSKDLEVIMLKNGYYLLFSHCPTTQNLSLKTPFELIGTLYSAADKALFGTIYGCKVFPNNWYILSFGAKRALYNDQHQMVAEWFGRCFAFGDGYYALQNANWLITSLNRRWDLYRNQKRLNSVENVEDFVGNSCMLVKKHNKKLYLSDLNGQMLCKMPVISWQKLLNNRFVLTFEDNTRRMYKPDGTPQGVTIGDELLLADGRFITLDRQIITGLYGANGIVETSCETPVKVKAYDYYFYQLEWYGKSMLFDANGTNLGENCTIISAKENFLLTEHADKICLFNQFGRVLVCDK